MGLRLRRPEIYARAAQVLSASEWIARLFTGRSYMEPTMACETQLYDLAGGEWSDRLCSVYGVDTSLLPELAPCGSAAGAILDEYVVRFNMADDAIFIIGGADTQLALRQTGLQAGEVAIVSGTTSPVVTLLDAPIWDEQQRLWIDAGLGGKGFLAEMNPGVTGLNYQRIKDMLCPETSYEELEQAYSEMKTFRCTASFSSLLFYERKSLRRGGFFARSPLDEHLTRIDMVWAVLADIACSTYEQLWRLTDITGVSTGHILGCGGGLRSGTLCSMLAELSGLELRLRTGFEQATIQGLSDVCADGLGHKAAVEESPVLSFPPGEYPLIREYYPVWLENREKANSL